MKFLFNRTSPVVRLLEASGAVLSLVYFFRLPRFDVRAGLLAFLVVCYVFLRACDLFPWAGIPRTLGIRVHFRKALVPASYILAATALFALLDIPVVSTSVAVIAVLMMLVVAPVNGILIYFHRRDKDPLPMNYFSSNQYLGVDTALPPNPSSVVAGEASGAPPNPLKNQTGKARFDSSHLADEIQKLQASGR